MAEACLSCGAPLVYFETAKEMECQHCHGKFMSNAACENGHYICDDCHSKLGVETILEYCLNEQGKDPIRMAMALMAKDSIYMHGPEHHVMVGAVLLTAFHNSGGSIHLPTALAEMAQRGSGVPGGICGLWGCCGAAISAGIYLSIALGATPLSEGSWGLCNQLTSACLQDIGSHGGPRCCKRDSFLAIRRAVQFTKEHLGIEMALPSQIKCPYSYRNDQCLKGACPFYGGNP
ncbi:MAG: SAM-dependent methyltransferase [Clostridiales bacterium]|nr:SAM-dependent methyltransferase [Clostridiales bacterium]